MKRKSLLWLGYFFAVASSGSEKGDASIEFLPLTQHIVDSFHSLTWEEKVPYIFVEEEWKSLVQEFQQYGMELVPYSSFVQHLSEFSEPEKIEVFWKGCDSDQDGYLGIMEYSHCRGFFDQYGEPYEEGEYEIRELALLEGFEPEYRLDENGIIVD